MKTTKSILLISVIIVLMMVFLGSLLFQLKKKIINGPEYGSCELITDHSYYKDESEGWHTIDAGAFSIRTPIRYKLVVCKGIDSFVGMITDKKDTLSFDYGWYSYSLEAERGKQPMSQDTINGKTAILVKKGEYDDGNTGVYIHQAFKENRFNLLGRGIEDEELIFKMIQSLMFKDSDSSLNSKNYAGKFRFTSVWIDGETIFRRQCSACHSLNNTFIGPKLSEIDSTIFFEWFNGEVINDPSVNSQKQTMGKEVHQNFLQEIKSDQIQLLYQYFKYN